MTLISAIVSAIINVAYSFYRDTNEAKRKRKEQQLKELYSPIWKKINDDIYENSYEEGYCGLHENTINSIVQIIDDNKGIADSGLLKWRDCFEKEVYESIRYIRPKNSNYDPLYDNDKSFFIFIETQIKNLRKDTYVDQ